MPEENVQCPAQSLSETGSLHEPGATAAGPPGSQRPFHLHPITGPRVQVCRLSYPGFYVGAWNLNAGSHAYATNTLTHGVISSLLKMVLLVLL